MKYEQTIQYHDLIFEDGIRFFEPRICHILALKYLDIRELGGETINPFNICSVLRCKPTSPSKIIDKSLDKLHGGDYTQKHINLANEMISEAMKPLDAWSSGGSDNEELGSDYLAQLQTIMMGKLGFSQKQFFKMKVAQASYLACTNFEINSGKQIIKSEQDIQIEKRLLSRKIELDNVDKIK